MAENLTTGVMRYIAQENVSKTHKTLGWVPQIMNNIGATNPVSWHEQVRKWGKDVGMP